MYESSRGEAPDHIPHWLLGQEVFDSEEAERIAEDTVWRTVNSKWDGIWEDESIPGQTFVYPKSGEWNGRLIEAELEAGCERDEMIVVHPMRPQDSYLAPLGRNTYSVTVTLREPAPEAYEAIIESIKEGKANEFSDWLEYEGLEEDQIFEPGQFSAKKCATFEFFKGGGYKARRFHAIFHKSGELVWDSLEGFVYDGKPDEDKNDEEQDSNELAGWVSPLFEDDLTLMDLKDIRAACEVLGAPEEARAYLAALCDQ